MSPERGEEPKVVGSKSNDATNGEGGVRSRAWSVLRCAWGIERRGKGRNKVGGREGRPSFRRGDCGWRLGAHSAKSGGPLKAAAAAASKLHCGFQHVVMQPQRTVRLHSGRAAGHSLKSAHLPHYLGVVIRTYLTLVPAGAARAGGHTKLCNPANSGTAHPVAQTEPSAASLCVSASSTSLRVHISNTHFVFK